LLFAAAFVFASCSNGSDSGEGTPAPSVFAVSFGIEGLPPNGTIEARVDGTIIMPNDVVQKGKTVTFTAMPKTNHKVKEWKVDGAVISNSTNTYVHTVTDAVDVKVSFESAGGERIAITQVRAKTAPLVLGSPIPDGLSYTYTDYLPASVEGEPAKLIANNSMYGWEKKNGTEWQDVSGQPCTEGIYRVQTQVRIDGAESAQYMLAPDIKVFVSVDDGTSYDEWSVSGVGNYEGYSYAWVISKEYPVSSSGHLALSQNNVDIPKSYVGKPITEVNIASIVSGGTLPYHFTLTSGALPAGLSLDESGAILGTPTAVQPGQTGRIARITVRDSASTPEEKLIDVFCTEGIVDKKVVTFAVGWRGTAPAPIEGSRFSLLPLPYPSIRTGRFPHGAFPKMMPNPERVLRVHGIFPIR